MKNNQKGFGIAGLLILLLVVATVIAGGWYVYNRNRAADTTSNTTPEVSQDDVMTNSYTEFSIEGQGRLTDKGKCVTGEILFARIFNSEPSVGYEFDCEGPVEAVHYSSVVFGQRDSSILSVFSDKQLEGTQVTLANGVQATKYVFQGTRRHDISADMVPVTFTIYEANDADDYFYALYWTGVGFDDENEHLDAFNSMVLNNWQIK